MSAYALALATLAGIALYCTWDLRRMRIESARLLADTRQAHADAEYALREAISYRESAMQFHRDACTRWALIATHERRIH